MYRLVAGIRAEVAQVVDERRDRATAAGRASVTIAADLRSRSRSIPRAIMFAEATPSANAW